MAWRIEFERQAAKERGRLDKAAARRITRFLRWPVARLEDPRTLAKPLQGELATLWRCQVICDLNDQVRVVLVVRIGHRKEVIDYVPSSAETGFRPFRPSWN